MRMAFMAYLTDSIDAVDFYCKAFNTNSKISFKASDNDNFYAHAEIAISDISHYEIEFPKGRNMEFWLTFDDEQALHRAYSILKEKAEIHYALAPCDWSKAMASLTDKYGICWLLNI